MSYLVNEEIYLPFREQIWLMEKGMYSAFILNIFVWFSFPGKHLVLQ